MDAIQAVTCANCRCPILGDRCASCGWMPEHDPICMCVECLGNDFASAFVHHASGGPVIVDDDDDDSDTDGTDLFDAGGEA